MGGDRGWEGIGGWGTGWEGYGVGVRGGSGDRGTW